MRVVSLVSATDPRHTKQAVQTLGRSIDVLLGVCGAETLVSLFGFCTKLYNVSSFFESNFIIQFLNKCFKIWTIFWEF
jgi:hypothetical protein